MQWTVLIPVKALPEAKSRLLGASADADAHRRLVEAIRADTVAAALAAPGVARIVLVVDRPWRVDGPGTVLGQDGSAVLVQDGSAVLGQDGSAVLVQDEPGLNAAVRLGAEHAARQWPCDGVAALVGDLPALRPAELGAALRHAATAERGYVADADGTGTTLLAGTPGYALRPEFGAGSAARHARSASPIPSGAGLRRDVDTPSDLDLAVALGVGQATAAELAAVAASRRSPCSGIVGA